MALKRILLGFALLVGCQNKDYIDPEPYTYTIERFKDVDKALILCNDEAEYYAVLNTLDPNIRSLNYSMSFNKHNKSASGIIYGIKVDVYIKGKIPKNKLYDIIALRGHQCEMEDLFNESKEHEDDNVLYLLGGCWSAYKYPGKWESRHRAVIGNIGKGNSSNNSHMFRLVLRGINKSPTWDELTTNIEKDSQFAKRQVYFPGEIHPDINNLLELPLIRRNCD